MNAARWWPLLLVLGCGDGGSTAFSVSLPAPLAANVKTLQFWLFANPIQKNLQCSTLQSQCVRLVPAAPAVLEGDFAGRTVAKVDYAAGAGTKQLAVDVAPGTYMVAVEALSDSGRLLANTCRTVTLPGEPLSLEFTPYTKDDCVALAP